MYICVFYYMISHTQEILLKNSYVARLQKQFEDVTNQTSSIENEVANFELKTRETNRVFVEVQMSIKNIYARIMQTMPKKASGLHTQVVNVGNNNASLNKEVQFWQGKCVHMKKALNRRRMKWCYWCCSLREM